MNLRSKFPSLTLDATAIAVLVFGVLTIRSGGLVVFGGEGNVAAAGAIVPFVVWFNFLAGFAYGIAAIGLWRRARWAAWLAVALAGATLVVFGAFALHVASGGLYETRTAWAMTVRSVVWLAVAALACATLGCIRRRA